MNPNLFSDLSKDMTKALQDTYLIGVQAGLGRGFAFGFLAGVATCLIYHWFKS